MPPYDATRLLSALLLVSALAPLSILAITTPEPGSLQDRVIPRALLLDETVDVDAEGARRDAFDRFVALEGGEWSGRLHAADGRAALLTGGSIPMMPGRGNTLPPESVRLTQLEQRVRALLSRHPDLLSPLEAGLVLSSARSGILDEGRLAYVDFDLVVAGRKVRGARVFARINNGNLVQVGSRLASGVPTSIEPALDSDEALDRAFGWIGGRTEVDIPFGEAELFFLPRQEREGLEYRLVWEVAFQRRGEVQTWTARVDAVSGEVLEFFDANRYGHVTGGVFPRTVTDGEIVVGMPYADVSGAGTTDRSGRFAYSGGEVSTGLDGQFFSTNCQGCADPVQTEARSDLGLGWLELGTGGADQLGNGLSVRSDRTGFYHLNLIRELATKWLDIPWFNSNVTLNTNINSTCNASWNGSINAYRSGGGCNNTGEIADVLYHEWGHGIDGNTLIGDSATGEGTGDTVSFAFTHDSLVGPYFRTTGSPVRDVNKDTTSKGIITRGNASSLCGTGPCLGPLGLECHCEGEIYGQTGWDLAQSLVAKHGFHTGWQVHERIFFSSLPQAGSYLPGQTNSIYDAYLAADDDDGNINNGTPNAAEIHAAFDAHEIAPNGKAPVSTAGCVRPAEPVVIVSGGCDGLTLSWDPVPGAVEYRVLRNEVSPTAGLLRVATVADNFFVDSEVLPDQDYHYAVEAVDGAGCTSTIEGVQTVSGPARPIVGITAVATDDTPAGNRSGTVDPGEAVDLLLTLKNFTGTAAGALVGSLATSTPGITLDSPSASFPDVAGYEQAQNSDTLRFSIDPSVACGTVIDFTFSLTDDSGCTTETQFFSVRTGVDAIRASDDFSADSGWTLDAGSSTAALGDWVRGDPVGTGGPQPETDADDSGNACWYTGANPGGVAGTDDVDDGEVVLVSPAFDLSGMSSPRIEYQRWFNNRDLGEDPDDYFWVEASDDAGASWQTVEKLGTNDTAPAWTHVSVDLAGIVALTTDVRFRVRVSDGTLDSNLIEGAFDDFRITEAECDETPPCFEPPAFAGAQSASGGPDCGEATVNWGAATSNCQNATISYTVYRSTEPGFTPDASTRIASGLTSLSFDDSLLLPDETYSYVVRAFDSRSGEESNSVERTASAPSSPDTTAPIFDGIVSTASGTECGETQLSWSAALESCSTPVVYEVYRSSTPGFTPAPTNLIAETTETSLVDAGVDPALAVYYVVRAVDQAGLSDSNSVEAGAEAGMKDLLVSLEDFEAGAGGWAQAGTNDATTGLWELGDPAGTDAQPGDCPSGLSCWATGLSGPGLGDNDVDEGTTTLLSAPFDATGLIEPGIRYSRYYSNNTGSSPGTDTWVVEISNDDGASWSTVESTNASDDGLIFTDFEFPLAGVLEPTNQMRVRFVASDLGEGSLVEAVIDDFRTVDLAGGCEGCGPAPAVGEALLVDRDGDDVILDWSGDPVSAGRFKVYSLGGPGFADASLIGTTTSKSYRHASGALLPGLTSYRVSAVDACAQEGPLE